MNEEASFSFVCFSSLKTMRSFTGLGRSSFDFLASESAVRLKQGAACFSLVM
jgi:hypothetical protein